MRGDKDIHPNWKPVRPNEYNEWYLDTPRENADILVKKDTAQFELHLRVNDDEYDKIATGFSHKIRETARMVADEIAKLLLTDIEYQPREEKQKTKIELENPTDTDAIRYEIYDIPEDYIDSIINYINNEYDETNRVSNGLKERTIHKIREIERREAAILHLNFGKFSMRVNDKTALLYLAVITVTIIALIVVNTYTGQTLPIPSIESTAEMGRAVIDYIVNLLRDLIFTPPFPK